MNVDCDNFHEVRKMISQLNLVKQSHFISFDLEFTGVRFDNNQRDKYDMFLNEKYQKMASVASKFNIVQVGLTFVVPKPPISIEQTKQTQTKESSLQSKKTEGIESENIGKEESRQQENQYLAYPFNFYVFPRESSTSNPIISMQAGCVEFNTTHDMDWNRWIRKGITYVRISQFNKHMQGSFTSNMNSTVTITNANENNAFNGKNYNSMVEQLSQKLRKIVEDIVEHIKDKNVGYKYSVQIPRFSSGVIRRAVQCYASQLSLDLMITKIANKQTETEVQAQELDGPKMLSQSGQSDIITLQIQYITKQKKLDEIEKQKESLLGFSLLFEEIWNSNKILVGHNCLYDILFLYSSFVDELPRDYQNFKKITCQKDCNRRFYDTKFIANKVLMGDMEKKGTSLDEIYKIYKDKIAQSDMMNKKYPLVSLPNGFQAYDLSKPILHEAGFDSYLTAWVFLHLPVEKQDENKLCIFKSYFYMNLLGPGDNMRKDLKIFVLAVVLNNVYVQYEELKNMRMAQSKLIRDQLQKQKLMNQVIVIDGFKQIFISMKDISKTDVLVRFLINLKKNKIVKKANVMSLQMWVKMRAETHALVVANTLSKTKSGDKQ